MRWDYERLIEGIEEFQRRSNRTQKSLADGSVGGATLLGSPVESVQMASPPVLPHPVTAGGADLPTIEWSPSSFPANEIPSGSWMTLGVTERQNRGGFWTVFTSTTIRAPAACTAMIFGVVSFDANGTGNRGIRVKINGGTFDGDRFVGAISGQRTSVPVLQTMRLNAGNTVEVDAWQDSGVSRFVTNHSITLVRLFVG